MVRVLGALTVALAAMQVFACGQAFSAGEPDPGAGGGANLAGTGSSAAGTSTGAVAGAAGAGQGSTGGAGGDGGTAGVGGEAGTRQGSGGASGNGNGGESGSAGDGGEPGSGGSGAGAGQGSAGGAGGASGGNGGLGGSSQGGASQDTPPSCVPEGPGRRHTCGVDGTDDCCARATVVGQTFYRNNDPLLPATVSSFVLDEYEVTIGRFRAFVAEYPGNMPAAGDGAHPKVAGSGWNPDWTALLPASADALVLGLKCHPSYQTWTDAPGATDTRPMNCMTWYEAFAFCIWDGGRLPTNAEWSLASTGGTEQRVFAWVGDEYDSSYLIADYTPIAAVGSKPKGTGRWGHADLLGNVSEFVLDSAAAPPPSCNDCANLAASAGRLHRGYSWTYDSGYFPNNVNTANQDAAARNDGIGVRCARDL